VYFSFSWPIHRLPAESGLDFFKGEAAMEIPLPVKRKTPSALFPLAGAIPGIPILAGCAMSLGEDYRAGKKAPAETT
jgi:hypothetical protein